jgi:hypothetical protein
MSDENLENTAVSQQGGRRHFLLLVSLFTLTLVLVIAWTPAQTQPPINSGVGPVQPTPAAGTANKIHLPDQHQLPVSWGIWVRSWWLLERLTLTASFNFMPMGDGR